MNILSRLLGRSRKLSSDEAVEPLRLLARGRVTVLWVKEGAHTVEFSIGNKAGNAGGIASLWRSPTIWHVIFAVNAGELFSLEYVESPYGRVGATVDWPGDDDDDDPLTIMQEQEGVAYGRAMDALRSAWQDVK